MVDIHLCKEDEIKDVMTFIDEYWGKGHIMAVDKELMDWQHKEEGYYNFVVAYVDGFLHGILGFIPMTHYDKNITQRTAYGAIWKVKPDSNIPMLGVRLLEYIEKHLGYDFIAIGINDIVSKLYPKLGYSVDKMNHFYILNDGFEGYKLIKGHKSISLTTGVGLRKTSDVPNGFVSRYKMHPYFEYEFYELMQGGNRCGLIVTRDIKHEGAKAVRIVDFIGGIKSLAYSGTVLLNLIKQKKAEYIHVYNHGWAKDVFLNAGFNEVSEDDIVPYYFEPFVKENVDIYFAMPNYLMGKMHLFTGRGDSDRPNIVRNV